MTKAQKQRRVKALIATWRPHLGLGEWTLDIQFRDDVPETASCTADPEYRKAILIFNLHRLRAEELDDTVLHECLHPVCWAISALAAKWAGRKTERREVVRQAEELLVTQLTNIVLPLLPKVVTI